MNYCVYYLTVSAFFIIQSVAASIAPHSYFLRRSQGQNEARSLATEYIRRGIFEGSEKSAFNAVLAYAHSRDSEALAQSLFGARWLTFSGSSVSERGEQDLLGDYFGLPTDFKGAIGFKPIARDIILAFEWYYNLSRCKEGLYFSAKAPLVHAVTCIKRYEAQEERGVLNYSAGYMSPNLIKRGALANSISESLSEDVSWGDLDRPLHYGILSRGSSRRTKVADLTVAVGYVPCISESGYLACDVHCVVPTGPSSRVAQLWQPQIGNGHHWAVGFKFMGARQIWDSCDGDSNLTFYLDATFNHLIGSWQQRTFDLCGNGAGSRYMLLQDMGKATVTDVIGLYSVPVNEDQYLLGPMSQAYHGRLLHANAVTTLYSKIRINLELDIAFKCSFEAPCWHLDVGYNFWRRSAEKLLCREPLASNRYVIKGDAQIYGYSGIEDSFWPLSASERCATVHAGQGISNASHNFNNSNIDSPVYVAINDVDQVFEQTTPAGLAGTGISAIEFVRTSRYPVFLSDAAIAHASGLVPSATSHTCFVQYTRNVVPLVNADHCAYLGLGASVEIPRGWTTGTLSQWSVWLTGGITY